MFTIVVEHGSASRAAALLFRAQSAVTRSVRELSTKTRVQVLIAIATSTTNVIGNSVAVLVLSKWERMFDQQKFDACVNGRHAPLAVPVTVRATEHPR